MKPTVSACFPSLSFLEQVSVLNCDFSNRKERNGYSCLMTDLLEYNEDRSPWETVEEKLDEIRFVTEYFVLMGIRLLKKLFWFCLFLFRAIMRKIIKRIPLQD